MTTTLTAIYENGVLRPLEPLSLPEHTRVTIHVSADSETSNDSDTDFEREQAAFERLLPKLLLEHPEKWVAVVGETVVEVGDNLLQVSEKVDERFGRVARYIQFVTAQPHVYRFPYRKVIAA